MATPASRAATAAALAALRTSEVFINGAWRATATTFPVLNPLNGVAHAQAPQGTPSLIDEAVRAAEAAGKTWGELPKEARAAHLVAFADELEKRKDTVASIEALNTGKPLREACGDIDDAIAALRYCARQALALDTYPQANEALPSPEFRGSIRYEPVGVVGAICPFNFPAMMAAWKIGPSLAAGCTIVVKPSEFTPFSTLALAEAAAASGLPAGVLNVVTGGGDVGAALTAHPLVAKVTFTGSGPTGAIVGAAAARDVKRCTLELGGKSPAVVLPDADLDAALEWLFFGFAWNAGQICSATARILVHESRAAEVEARLAAACSRVRAGGPFDEGSELGPVGNAMQARKVRAYIAGALAQGARLVCGGGAPAGLPADYADGCFVAPTIFAGVTPAHTIFREEVFGPVATITTFSTDDEALALANDCDFGLAAAVFTSDPARAERFAAGIRAGVVWVNNAQPSPHAQPWGGFKKSGVGREMGPLALLPFLEVKAVTRWEPAGPCGWYPSSHFAK